MTNETIEESGMQFGAFTDGLCCYIEKSTTLEQINKRAKKGEGVQIAEFLLLRQKEGHSPVIWLVEAKSSSPQPTTQPEFDKYIDDIKEKLSNTLSLCFAMLLKRHQPAETDLSNNFKQLDLSTVSFRLILVINGHKTEWLPPLQNALQKALASTIKIWGEPFSSVIVMNEIEAKKHNLIISE
ncbi:MAG: hypothetical protein GQ569_03100 [Methylococcaceae bacterium]|nr:hypothetical protein [Methylococcaceae bacterium]